ncbi:MAG TPA: hypothetical protein VNX01_11940 [Bacteroidia bacterium]|nr:hypothetical protein [Bacteroidia bacterium]
MKKLFPAITICIVASLIIMACKKSSSTTSTSSTTTSTTSTTNVVLGPYVAQLQVNNQFDDNTLSTGTKDSTGSAATIIFGALNIGTVSLNNTVLTFSYTSYYIPTGVIAPVRGKPTWQVTGGSGFGAFTYTTVKSVPYFGDLHISTSTVTRSGNVVITHPVIYADSIRYSIIDNNSNMATKVVGNSSTGFTFTPAMMTALGATNSGASIQISGSVSENSLQGGKVISFQNGCSYNKYGITIN